MLCWEYLLNSNLILIFLVHLKFAKIEISFSVKPLHFEFPKIFMISISGYYSEYFPYKIPILIVESAYIPYLEDLILKLKLRIDLFLF